MGEHDIWPIFATPLRRPHLGPTSTPHQIATATEPWRVAMQRCQIAHQQRRQPGLARLNNYLKEH